MRRISAEVLRRTSLARQFPTRPGRGSADVLELIAELGPIQSQVPRAPFLTASSRLPGVSYETVRDLFAEHRLLKTSSLRGTVHTTTRADFVRADTVSRTTRAPVLRRTLKLGEVPVAELEAEIEQFAGDRWRPRGELVDHIRAWLAGRGVEFEDSSYAQNLIWGHSGLLRRPKDSHWEKRTDVFHTSAAAVVELPPRPDPAAALVDLVRGHLRAYGPLTRADLAFFFAVGLGQVDSAVTTLGDEVTRLVGPSDEPLLDLSAPATDGDDDPGVRLLPEFDGLLLGYAGPHRTRFCHAEHLDRVFNKTNGVCSPVVLAHGRIRATWRTVSAGRRAGRERADLEIAMLPGESPLGEDALTDQVEAVRVGLALDVRDVRVLR